MIYNMYNELNFRTSCIISSNLSKFYQFKAIYPEFIYRNNMHNIMANPHLYYFVNIML